MVGCGKSKTSHAVHQARDLYTGSLFRARKAYAEASGTEWWIASARHGLMDPDQGPVSPYDETMRDLEPLARASWGLRVAADLLDAVADLAVKPGDLEVELHLGQAYAKHLAGILEAAGVRVTLPLAGLQVGECLAWYRARREAVARG